MDSQTKSNRGQSLIETTLAIPAILLFLSVGMAYIFSLKEKFKHDFLAKNQNSQSSDDSKPPSLDLAGKLLSPQGKSVKARLDDLEDQGWELKTQMKTAEKIFYLFTRGNQHLFFDGKNGVVTCGSDCSN